MKKKACVHIYTGDGKGKTTASLGLALRSLGHGKRVGFFQFLKKTNYKTGELKFSGNLGKNFTYIQFDEYYPLAKRDGLDKTTKDTLRKIVIKDFLLVQDMIKKEKFDLVILDEIINAIKGKFLDEKKVLSFLDSRPSLTEVVLTGRGASARLKGKAHYVTEMKPVKHPYKDGLCARCGIEY